MSAPRRLSSRESAELDRLKAENRWLQEERLRLMAENERMAIEALRRCGEVERLLGYLAKARDLFIRKIERSDWYQEHFKLRGIEEVEATRRYGTREEAERALREMLGIKLPDSQG